MRRWSATCRSQRSLDTSSTPPVADVPDRHQLDPELGQPVKEPAKVRLVDDVPGQHWCTRDSLHMHAFELPGEEVAELAPQDCLRLAV
jgi:hypothetical protein